MKQRKHMVNVRPPAGNAGENPSRVQPMCALFARFKRNDHGNIAVMFALMLPVLLGIVGLGIDAGIWFKERRELQTIADAAAVSAAIENSNGATAAEVLAIAQIEATRNGFDPTTDTLVYASTPQTGPNVGDVGYVEVRVERELLTFLSQIFLPLPPTTSARAVATTVSEQEACVLALSPTAQNAVYLNGNGTSVTMAGCSVVANSTHSTKAINVQNGSLTTECLSTAGGISGEANMTTACSSTVSGAKPADDPYASLPDPTPGACINAGDTNAYTPADGEVLSQATYCKGISISAGTSVTMAPGTYIIDQGDFTVNGNASISGTGVTIILTSSTATGLGAIKITGGGTVALSAPTTGDYTGVLFYQDQNIEPSSNIDSIVTGGAEVELNGAIYLPNNDLSFSGGSTADSNGCLMLVAQTVSFNGTADIDNECDMYGGNPVKFGEKPGLIE